MLPAPPLKRMPQLDGVRGIAILFVLISHWISPTIGMTLPWGTMGVRTFFVLSGFLITGILLRGRSDIDSGHQSVGFTIKQFYARRCLRIFAVYYLFLFVRIVFFDQDTDRWQWDVLYLSNFHDILVTNGPGLHLWSLAVEEQFYIIWPILVLTIPQRLMLPAMWAIIITAVATRVGLATTDMPYLCVKKFTLTCADALALGGVVACLHFRQGGSSADLQRVCRWTTVVGLPLFIIAIATVHLWGKENFAYISTAHTSFALLATAALIPAIDGYGGVIGRTLSWKPLMWIGTISYGLYLIHMDAMRVVVGLMSWADLEFQGSFLIVGLMKLVCYTVTAFSMAAISWYAFELPINSLKRHFPMRKPAGEATQHAEAKQWSDSGRAEIPLTKES